MFLLQVEGTAARKKTRPLPDRMFTALTILEALEGLPTLRTDFCRKDAPKGRKANQLRAQIAVLIN